MFEQFNRLKGLFVEDIPDAGIVVDPPKTVSVVPKTVSVSPVSDIDTSVTSQTSSEKVAELRRQVVPVQGPLFVFNSVLTSLEAAIPNEAMRFKTALNVVAAQGLTVANISREIDSIFSGVDEHKTKAETLKADKLKTQVTDKRQRITELEKQIEGKRAEINTLIFDKEKLELEAQESETRIKERSWEWEAARAALTTEFSELNKKLAIYTETKIQGASK